MKVSTFFVWTGVLLCAAGCKMRSYNSSSDSVKDGRAPSADAPQQAGKDEAANPACTSYETVTTEYQNGAQTETDYVRLKLQPKKWQGKDINGASCEVTIDSTSVSSRRIQTVTFSAKFKDFNLPKVFRDVEGVYLGLANDVENKEKVAEIAASLGDNPDGSSKTSGLVDYSALFGAFSAGGLSPINKVVRLSVSKKSCSPVFLIVQSSYPLERKANICVFQ